MVAGVQVWSPADGVVPAVSDSSVMGTNRRNPDLDPSPFRLHGALTLSAATPVCDRRTAGVPPGKLFVVASWVPDEVKEVSVIWVAVVVVWSHRLPNADASGSVAPDPM